MSWRYFSGAAIHRRSSWLRTACERGGGLLIITYYFSYLPNNTPFFWLYCLQNITYLKISATNEKVDFYSLFLFGMLQSLVDLVQLAMATTLHGNLEIMGILDSV